MFCFSGGLSVSLSSASFLLLLGLSFFVLPALLVCAWFLGVLPLAAGFPFALRFFAVLFSLVLCLLCVFPLLFWLGFAVLCLSLWVCFPLLVLLSSARLVGCCCPLLPLRLSFSLSFGVVVLFSSGWVVLSSSRGCWCPLLRRVFALLFWLGVVVFFCVACFLFFSGFVSLSFFSLLFWLWCAFLFCVVSFPSAFLSSSLSAVFFGGFLFCWAFLFWLGVVVLFFPLLVWLRFVVLFSFGGCCAVLSSSFLFSSVVVVLFCVVSFLLGVAFLLSWFPAVSSFFVSLALSPLCRCSFSVGFSCFLFVVFFLVVRLRLFFWFSLLCFSSLFGVSCGGCCLLSLLGPVVSARFFFFFFLLFSFGLVFLSPGALLAASSLLAFLLPFRVRSFSVCFVGGVWSCLVLALFFLSLSLGFSFRFFRSACFRVAVCPVSCLLRLWFSLLPVVRFWVFRFFVSFSLPVFLLCFLRGLGFRPVVWSGAGGARFAEGFPGAVGFGCWFAFLPLVFRRVGCFFWDCRLTGVAVVVFGVAVAFFSSFDVQVF